MSNETRVKVLAQRLSETPGFVELTEKMLNDEATQIALRPRIEFLASVPTNQDVENSVLEFFEQVHLTDFPWDYDNEKNEYRVCADTYSVTVNLLPCPNPRLKQAEILLIAVEAQEFGELETIRDMILEVDLSSQFRDFLLIWDANGSIRSWTSYIALHLLENQLRKLVVSTLMGIEDSRWWDHRIKGLSGGTYQKYKHQEQNAQDITHYPDEIAQDIFFTDLSAIEKVVSDSTNWNDVFQPIFLTSKYTQKLSLLNRLRRKIAHNRFLTERNSKDLHDLLTEFLRAFRRVWRN